MKKKHYIGDLSRLIKKYEKEIKTEKINKKRIKLLKMLIRDHKKNIEEMMMAKHVYGGWK